MKYAVYAYRGHRPRKIRAVAGPQEALDAAASLNATAPNAYFAGGEEEDGTVVRIKSVEEIAINTALTLEELKELLDE